MRLRAILMLCLLSLLWGSGWLATPVLAASATPFAASALVFGLSAVSLAVVSLLPVGSSPEPAAGQWQASIVLGVVMLGVPTLLLLLAREHGIGGWEPLLYALLPLLVSVGQGAPALRAVVPAGATLVLLQGTVRWLPGRAEWIAVALLAISLQAFGLVFAARRLRGASWLALVRSVALQGAIASAMLAAASLLWESPPRLAPFSQWQGSAELGLLLLSLLGTSLASLLLYRLLGGGVLKPPQVATTQWLQLLVGWAEALLLTAARPSWPALGAAAVLGLGAVAMLLSPDEEQPVTLGGPR